MRSVTRGFRFASLILSLHIAMSFVALAQTLTVRSSADSRVTAIAKGTWARISMPTGYYFLAPNSADSYPTGADEHIYQYDKNLGSSTSSPHTVTLNNAPTTTWNFGPSFVDVFVPDNVASVVNAVITTPSGLSYTTVFNTVSTAPALFTNPFAQPIPPYPTLGIYPWAKVGFYAYCLTDCGQFTPDWFSGQNYNPINYNPITAYGQPIMEYPKTVLASLGNSWAKSWDTRLIFPFQGFAPSSLSNLRLILSSPIGNNSPPLELVARSVTGINASGNGIRYVEFCAQDIGVFNIPPGMMGPKIPSGVYWPPSSQTTISVRVRLKDNGSNFITPYYTLRLSVDASLGEQATNCGGFGFRVQ